MSLVKAYEEGSHSFDDIQTHLESLIKLDPHSEEKQIYFAKVNYVLNNLEPSKE